MVELLNWLFLVPALQARTTSVGGLGSISRGAIPVRKGCGVQANVAQKMIILHLKHVDAILKVAVFSRKDSDRIILEYIAFFNISNVHTPLSGAASCSMKDWTMDHFKF
jgi:hypothetical protein